MLKTGPSRNRHFIVLEYFFPRAGPSRNRHVIVLEYFFSWHPVSFLPIIKYKEVLFVYWSAYLTKIYLLSLCLFKHNPEIKIVFGKWKKTPVGDCRRKSEKGRGSLHYQPATTVGDWGLHPLKNQIISKTIFYHKMNILLLSCCPFQSVFSCLFIISF